ncbi:MAG: ABC-F family ATP-binding cassette domain-containing protein [Calditrichota bacterium]
MRLLQLDNISLTLPGRTLLDSVNWSVFRGERYGLVGANGSGKTTLLKIILGGVEPSTGNVQRMRQLTVGYLPQEGVTHTGTTLFEEAWNGLPDLPRIEQELTQLREQVSHDHANEELIERLGVLQHRWEDLEGYHAEAKVSRVLAGLGFRETDHQRHVEEFSGGWQMRIALAKLLLFDPDLLLLDEPTNHLDLPALIWLEDYLGGFSGSLVLVSHDRRFLDRVISRIAEIERAKLTFYDGNYSEYEELRATRQEQLEAEATRVEGERKRIEEFVERFRYKASKARQVQSRIKMLEKMAPVEVQPKSTRHVRFRFPSAPPSGRIVLELSDLKKNYGSIQVFHDVNLVLSRGEKVALVGVNGAGKSTLCRLIAGVESPSLGTMKLGHNVVVDYFAQEADFHLDAKRTVLEEMESEAQGVTQAGLRSLLGAFLFSGDDVFKRVSVLSGGEKSRLALAKMLLHPSNFIILDEPTNHLDMASQNVLLEALQEYEGTLIVVSHDRYFLDRLVDRVLEMDSSVLHDWPGNLSEYIERKGFLAEAQNDDSVSGDRVPVAAAPQVGFKSREQKRQEAEIRNRHSQTLREARTAMEMLQAKIEKSEARIAEIEPLLADEELYRDPDKCRSLMSEYEKIRRNLPDLMKEWEVAAVKYEALEKQRDAELQTRQSESE